MRIERYSATAMFGVPVDNPANLREPADLLRLFGAYDITGQPIATELTDITPYYWQQPQFRYLMSRASANGPVEVDFMPTTDRSEMYLTGIFDEPTLAVQGLRRMVIPTMEPMVVIAGGSPRFVGQVCVHEAIVCHEL